MRKMKLYALLASILLVQMVGAQSDYFGAGEDSNVSVTTSSNYQPPGWEFTASGDKTINGHGLDARLLETTRFLTQATLGADIDLINEVAGMTYEEWINLQIEDPSNSMLLKLDETYDEVRDFYIANGGDSLNFPDQPNWLHFTYSWWDDILKTDQPLRHKVAFALSEILVISTQTELGGFGNGLASYYDILFQNAFGNFRDILLQVTLHPTMGFYLSHLNNPKAIPEENIHPDENYAREVMQLFSIGLYELNEDGSRKLDNNGDFIPTYGQNEITEFAKVFTGLGISEIRENPWVDSAQFNLSIYIADMTKPMKMYEDWHQQGEKRLLNGVVLPNGQSGMKDVEDAIDNLFNHPNVGPFIGRLLIQRLVKSNPSPAYIARVTQAFNDNGAGERGDMGAVIRAILLDEEARSCDGFLDERGAKLKEPLIRHTQFAAALPKDHVYGRYWNTGYSFMDITGQGILASPSVFNFFLPDYQPVGQIKDLDAVAPEYQIHNTKTSVGFINHANSWTVWNNLLGSWEQGEPPVGINIDQLKKYAADPEALLNELDKLLIGGQLTDRTRGVIKEAISPLIWNNFKEDRVRLALYLVLISPDFAIQH